MIIPKIELKTTYKQLQQTFIAVEFNLPEIPFFGHKAKTLKSYYSLLTVVRTKLAKKLLSKQGANKPFKLTLEYYEALCLHETMKAVEINSQAQQLFDQLDQKLA